MPTDHCTARADRAQALDDKLPIPDDIDVIEVDWRGPGKGMFLYHNGLSNFADVQARAVYHCQIRKYLIERDIKKYGRYRKWSTTLRYHWAHSRRI